MKEYICPFCTEIFYSRNKFIAHKRFCKLNPDYEKNMDQIKKASILGAKIHKNLCKNKPKIIKTFVCEKCGKEFTREYTELQLKLRKRFPRFCSRKCSNTKIHSQETKDKISQSVKEKLKTIEIDYSKRKKSIGKTIQKIKKCVICNKEFIHDPSHPKQTCSKECCTKLLSNKVQERIKNGTHKGWMSRKIISYPEKFFMKVLQNNNIPYEHNYVVKKKDLGIDCSSCYFLDFKLPNNIDLEIDGGQHKDRIEHDLKRDKILTEHNYKVYRIEWNNINTEDGKKLMKDKIDKFLNFYNFFYLK
jgi:hypothetical protein